MTDNNLRDRLIHNAPDKYMIENTSSIESARQCTLRAAKADGFKNFFFMLDPTCTVLVGDSAPAQRQHSRFSRQLTQNVRTMTKLRNQLAA